MAFRNYSNLIFNCSQRRNNLTCLILKKLLHPVHKLHELVPDGRVNLVNYSLRNDHHVNLIDCKTSIFRNSFLPSSIVPYNDLLK